MKKFICSLIVCCLFMIGGISFTSMNAQDVTVSNVKIECPEGTGSSTVTCRDVENYGEGIHRNRICEDCTWQNHQNFGTGGECTFCHE